MVGVKVIGSDPDFQPELAAAGSRLAVVKFTMAGYVGVLASRLLSSLWLITCKT